MFIHNHMLVIYAVIMSAFTHLEISYPKSPNQSVTCSYTRYANKIVDGNKCNSTGVEKYILNSDPTASYNVSVNVISIKVGNKREESLKVISVPAGGKVFLGCTQTPDDGGIIYSYFIAKEIKK